MSASPARRPNILLIVTDQHRPDHTGFGGNAVVQTPTLDAIAARGTRFDKAYVANPICMPNRSTIMTGRMPSVHGVRFNGISLDPGVNTCVRVLRGAGYRTGLVGKAHLQNMGHGEGMADAVFPNPVTPSPPRGPTVGTCGRTSRGTSRARWSCPRTGTGSTTWSSPSTTPIAWAGTTTSG